ncbi:uncharacterized protein F5147DRAFT_771609 [Suillus discolor]|uniref:Uncharacterized protein n=1 Tax=Suillus discolor TaxID=1912936 RepID=A0A9P7JWA3_9AGAM|nr:uncharacterized protein F5147DRAFT_771609 [Suillus discolor]KAG2112050.1 hypothetical protein F5147DRAFT_771609 [Suillus discolor]
MPRQSIRKYLLNAVDQAALALARMQAQDILDDWSDLESETDSDSDSLSTSNDDDISHLDESNNVTMSYDRLQDTITALHDKVKRVHVLHKPDEPPPQAPQLHMLVHHEEHRPHLFQQKLCVNPEIFDNILDHISDHPIFQNQSNNPQLPISI